MDAQHVTRRFDFTTSVSRVAVKQKKYVTMFMVETGLTSLNGKITNASEGM